jgi:hypothetical protein
VYPRRGSSPGNSPRLGSSPPGLRWLIVLVVALLAALGSATAHAARRGNLSTRVEGTVVGGPGSFGGGSLVVSSFELRDGKLVALGSLDGTIRGADGKSIDMAERDVVLTVDRATLAATCDQAKLRLLPIEVAEGGVRVRLEPIELEIAAANATGPRLRDSLCELSRLLTTSANDGAVNKQLGIVLDGLE